MPSLASSLQAAEAEGCGPNDQDQPAYRRPGHCVEARDPHYMRRHVHSSAKHTWGCSPTAAPSK